MNMSRRNFIKAGFASAVAIGTSGMASAENARKGKKPNLVIVFPDQMRAHAMGFMKEDAVITPVLDSFAKEGTVFTQAVSSAPVCSPFRASMMTGKYPHGNGVLSNCNSRGFEHGYELRKTDRCWPDILKDKGYSLGYIGKWHLDSPHKPYVECANNRGKTAWNEWCSPDRRHGFDFWYAYGTYDYHFRPLYWRTGAKRDEFHCVDQWGPEHEADMAARYINNENRDFRDENQPFALVVSMNPPHTGYEFVPKKYQDMYRETDVEKLCVRQGVPPQGTKWGDYYRRNIKNYLAMVTGVDEQFGRILKAIDKRGLKDDTIVIFMSDHGNCLGIHNEEAKNNHYEESMRIPFIIRWPGKIKSVKDDLLFSPPDIYPTIMGLMGFEDDVPEDVEGTDFSSLLLGGETKRPSSQLYIRVPYGEPSGGQRGVRTKRYTLMAEKVSGGSLNYVLHDNIEDPCQMKNIADEHLDLVKDLIEKELRPWLKKTSDPWIVNLEEST